MDLYDAIFYRKSTQKYSNHRVSIDVFNEVKSVCESVNEIYKNKNIKSHYILKGDSLKFILNKKNRIVAPHYILITSRILEDEEEVANDNYLYNVGYAGQEIVLKLTQLGLATCWLDDTFNKVSINDFVHLEELEIPVALIAFGFPDDKSPLFRKLEEEPNRKQLKDMCKNLNNEEIELIDCMRYAPSYKNSQPCVFFKEGEHINLYIRKSVKNKLTKVDIGIALKHFDIACDKKDINPIYSKEEVKNKFRKEYILSISH